MNTSVKIAAVLALVIGGQALAASTVTHEIWIGGNNNDSTWENGPSPHAVDYVLAANGNLDGQTVTTERLNWAIVVNVTGQQDAGKGAGYTPAGMANMVFDLELQDGSGNTITTLTAQQLSPGQSVPAGKGWYSTINDGDNDGLVKNDPRKNAAFAISYDIDGMRPADVGGLVYDAYSNGGPFMDQYTFPSADGWWEGPGHTGQASGTACGGKLLGMGAGYSGAPATGQSGFLLAYYTPGVGLPSSPEGCLEMGDRAIFEGQLSMKGLANGSYKLKVTPQGTNVLANVGNGAICILGTSGGFADPPDNTPAADEIAFTLNVTPACDPLSIVSAVSQKAHGTAGNFDVNQGATEGRRYRPTKIVTTFNQNIARDGNANDCTVTSGTITGYSIAGAVLTVTLTNDSVTNQADFRIYYPGIYALGCPTVRTTANRCWKVVDGETNNNTGTPAINSFDLTYVRSRLGQAVTSSNFRADVNITGGSINSFDLTYVRSRLGKSYSTACTAQEGGFVCCGLGGTGPGQKNGPVPPGSLMTCEVQWLCERNPDPGMPRDNEVFRLPIVGSRFLNHMWREGCTACRRGSERRSRR